MDAIRILLLEDDGRLRAVLEEVLCLEGYHVVSAADGAEAVEKAENFPFELLVFDVKLPGPDGLEILSRFKAANPDLPSIVITGYASEADTLRALRLGVGEYLEKPFDSQVLVNTVKRMERVVLQRRSAQVQKEAFDELLLWSLNFLNRARAGSEKNVLFSPERAGKVAFEAACASGFDPAAARELQQAVLMKIAQQLSAAQDDLDELSFHIPDSIQQTCESLDIHKDSQGLLKIGSLSATLPFDQSHLVELRSCLGESKELVPNKFSEMQQRHLLSLGRSLIATRDFGGAKAAFEKIVSKAAPREKGLAYVELSRLAWLSGKKESAINFLREVMGLLPSLGPQAASELELESAQIALTMELDQGRTLLSRAASRIERSGAKGLLSQVELVRRLLDSKTPIDLSPILDDCLAQPRLEFLVKGAIWFLPLVSRTEAREGREELCRLTCRVAQASPDAVVDVLRGTKDSKKLEVLLKLLCDGGFRHQSPILEQIANQGIGTASKLASQIRDAKQVSKREIKLFSIGPVEVRLGDATVAPDKWRTTRSRHLFARLVQAERRSVPHEVLIEEFWPGMSPERGRRNLSQTLSDLRKALRDSGYQMADELILRKREAVTLADDIAVWHDLGHFRVFLNKGLDSQERGELRAAITHFQEALQVVRGGFMEDCKLAWSDAPRRVFERELLHCLERLGLCCQKVGLFPELQEVALRILEEDPCHQVAHGLLMEAYTKQQRPEQAIRHFEKARVVLLNELGIEPHTDLLRAYQVAKLAL